MTAATKDPLSEMIREEADMIEAGLKLQGALQAQGLDLLLAEMHALTRLMPGAGRDLPSDAETEAQFDNMPV